MSGEIESPVNIVDIINKTFAEYNTMIKSFNEKLLELERQGRIQKNNMDVMEKTLRKIRKEIAGIKKQDDNRT